MLTHNSSGKQYDQPTAAVTRAWPANLLLCLQIYLEQPLRRTVWMRSSETYHACSPESLADLRMHTLHQSPTQQVMLHIKGHYALVIVKCLAQGWGGRAELTWLAKLALLGSPLFLNTNSRLL